MSLNSLSPRRAGGKRWLGRLVTLACLAALVLGLNHWLGQRQNQDLSFLLPIYQDGQQISPAAIISDDGQVLLPVRAVAENNGWLCQSSEIQAAANAEVNADAAGPLWGGSLLLLRLESADGQAGGCVGICWFGTGPAEAGQIGSLGVWCGGQPLGLSSAGRIYQQELYLPEDFFAAAFGLQLRLDENGKANLLPQAQPQA